MLLLALRNIQRKFTTNNVIRVSYPFDYTFSAQEFQLNDYRFTPLPINKHLNQHEISHYSNVLKYFCSLINHKNYQDKQFKPFIHPLLSAKIQSLKQILSEQQITLNININYKQIAKTIGYYQIYGAPFTTNSICQKYIHQFNFERQQQKLIISNKKMTQFVSPDKKIQQDIDEISQKTHERKQIKNNLLKSQKTKNTFFKIADFLSRINKKNSKAQPTNYITVDQLEGIFQYNIKGNNINIQSQGKFNSLWAYEVSNSEVQSIRKNRKRVLFDFQHWNRGSLIPIKQFL